MRTIGIKVLRNRLREYLRLAQTGETILVTDRDQVVTEIHPPSPSRALALADPQLKEAVRQAGSRRPCSCLPVRRPASRSRRFLGSSAS